MKTLKTIGKILLPIGITIAGLLLACILAIFLLEKGPSEKAKVLFVNAVNETSRMGPVSRMFLSKEEVDDILNSSAIKELDIGESSDVSQIKLDEDEFTDAIEIEPIRTSTFSGVMMIVHDPSKVFAGVIPEFGDFDGLVVSEIIDTYNERGLNVVGGINGGDFVDRGMNDSATAQPLGIVVSQGEIVYQEPIATVNDAGEYVYHISGFTKDDKFVIGNLSVAQIEEMGIRDAIYTKHETGPFLIMNGELLIEEVPNRATYGGGPNPRTAIGQRKDGTVLLLVLNGRQANSLGATFKDMVYTMQEYGAYNAAAMDGGTSSQMIYEGEIKNQPYSAYGVRKCPTSWLVFGE